MPRYRLLEAYWGKGYATEAGRRLVQYGFEQLYLPRIVAVALEANRASTRVLEKIGLQYDRKGVFYGFDCVVYTLERERYLADRSALRGT